MTMTQLLRLAYLISLAVGLQGFSPQSNVEPLMAIPRTFLPGTSTVHRGSLNVLFVSKGGWNDIESSRAASTTQLGSSVAEATMEDARANAREPQRMFGERALQQMRQLDFNEIINTSLLVIIAVAVLVKLAAVNGGITRGWTVEELGARIAVDNWDGYIAVLSDNPVATKAATSATVYTIGDIIAQRTEGTKIGDLDRSRVLRSLLAGGIGHGPMSHYWYEFSEFLFGNVLHLTQWWSFIPKIAIDQTLWGPIWNNSYIILLGLMKLESPEVIWRDMKRTTIPLILSGLKLWPLAHCITYGLIPVENRLLWVDMVEILWVTILATQAAGTVVVLKEDTGSVSETTLTKN